MNSEDAGALWRSVRLVLVTSVLLLSAGLGLKEGVNSFRGAESVLQYSAAVAQLGYGVAAVLALLALYRNWQRLAPILAFWSLTITLTSALAPVAWGGAGWVVGLGSGAAMALVAALVAWGALAHARSRK